MAPGPVVEAEPAAVSTTEEVKSTVEETLPKKPPQVFFCFMYLILIVTCLLFGGLFCLCIQKQNEDEPVVEDVKEDEKEDEDEDEEDEDEDDDTPGTSFSHFSYWVLVLYFS